MENIMDTVISGMRKLTIVKTLCDGTKRRVVCADEQDVAHHLRFSPGEVVESTEKELRQAQRECVALSAADCRDLADEIGDY